jgi:hypothetical protein
MLLKYPFSTSTCFLSLMLIVSRRTGDSVLRRG